MSTTDDETKLLPFTLRRKPCCTSAKVIVLTEREAMLGAGRELPHSGLSAWQPGSNSKASRRPLRVQPGPADCSSFFREGSAVEGGHTRTNFRIRVAIPLEWPDWQAASDINAGRWFALFVFVFKREQV